MHLRCNILELNKIPSSSNSFFSIKGTSSKLAVIIFSKFELILWWPLSEYTIIDNQNCLWKTYFKSNWNTKIINYCLWANYIWFPSHSLDLYNSLRFATNIIVLLKRMIISVSVLKANLFGTNTTPILRMKSCIL